MIYTERAITTATNFIQHIMLKNINIRHKHITHTWEYKISKTQKSLKLCFCLLLTGWIAEILCHHLWRMIHHHRP